MPLLLDYSIKANQDFLQCPNLAVHPAHERLLHSGAWVSETVHPYFVGQNLIKICRSDAGNYWPLFVNKWQFQWSTPIITMMF